MLGVVIIFLIKIIISIENGISWIFLIIYNLEIKDIINGVDFKNNRRGWYLKKCYNLCVELIFLDFLLRLLINEMIVKFSNGWSNRMYVN